MWVTVTETMELSVIAQGEKTVRGAMAKPCKGKRRKRSPGKTEGMISVNNRIKLASKKVEV